MDIKERLDKYDELINSTMVNLYMMSEKGQKKLTFSNLNRYDKAHLTLLNIIKNAHTMWNIEFEVKVGFWDFQWIKRNLKATGWMTRNKEANNDADIDCYSFIKAIETFADVKGYFADIYDEYYAKGN